MTDARSVQTVRESDLFGRPVEVTEAFDVAGDEGTTVLGWDANGNLSLVTPPGRTAHDHTLLYNFINELQEFSPPTLPDLPSTKTTFAPTQDRSPFTEVRPDGTSIVKAYVSSPVNTGQLDTITFSGGAGPAGIIDYDYYTSTETNASSGQAPGKVKAITGPSIIGISLEYDGSLPTKETWTKVKDTGETSSGSVSREYGTNLLPKSETVTPVFGGASTRYFAYDKDQLLTCLGTTAASTCSTLDAGEVAISRSANHGQVTGFAAKATTSAGTLNEAWEYSDTVADATAQKAFGELRSQTLRFVASGDSLAKIVYDDSGQERDQLGRIAFKTEQFGASTRVIGYGYDSRGRLETVEHDGAEYESFGYDSNGNRTSYEGPMGESLIGTYDDQDRLKVYGTTTTGTAIGYIKYTYGANGELSRRDIKTGASTTASWLYTYDAKGNLRTVVKPGATSNTTYTYLVDGKGRRVAKREKVGTGTDVLKKRWLYRDSLAPVAELDAGGAIVARFVYGSRASVPDLVIKGGNTYRLFTDQLGSPRLAINIADPTDVPYRADYSAFGEVIGGFGAPDWIPFGFAGGLNDPDTGLIRFGARDYDPHIGRWVSKDPIRFSGHQTNLYAYVNSDPVNRRDPSGLDGILDFLLDEIMDAAPYDAGKAVSYGTVCYKNPILCRAVVTAEACLVVADALYESPSEMERRLIQTVADEYNRSFYQNADSRQSQDMLEGGMSIDAFLGGSSSSNMSGGI